MTFLVSSNQLLKASRRARHKVALKLLVKAITGHYASLSDYRFVESLLDLPSLDLVDTKKVSDRLQLHKQQVGQVITEASFQAEILTDDKESSTPFLDVHVVLNQLRSAFNVGSILRTTESMRLGSLYFEGITPKASSEKVQKTAMGCHDKVPCFDLHDVSALPRPIIGLETAKNAASIYDFKFPRTFTLILGNEEYGLSDEWLKACDQIVTIPMWGFKNSLNVASAYAITAYEIRKQHTQSQCL
jgi:tRNA G18 (ribose-2'-O)-methylase SpoU